MKINNQQGFTLIELVVVIVILGILAATALPKFVDISGDAQLAATKGVAGAMGSAMVVNYGARLASSNAKGSAVTDCDTWAILTGGQPGGYTIASVALSPAGTTATCTITGPSSTSATFTGIGA